jgi:hypothetical protein
MRHIDDMTTMSTLRRLTMLIDIAEIGDGLACADAAVGMPEAERLITGTPATTQTALVLIGHILTSQHGVDLLESAREDEELAADLRTLGAHPRAATFVDWAQQENQQRLIDGRPPRAEPPDVTMRTLLAIHSTLPLSRTCEQLAQKLSAVAPEYSEVTDRVRTSAPRWRDEALTDIRHLLSSSVGSALLGSAEKSSELQADLQTLFDDPRVISELRSDGLGRQVLDRVAATLPDVTVREVGL